MMRPKAAGILMKDERIMKKIGLFYAANAVKTSQIAEEDT